MDHSCGFKGGAVFWEYTTTVGLTVTLARAVVYCSITVLCELLRATSMCSTARG
jgi:hypothetical protein